MDDMLIKTNQRGELIEENERKMNEKNWKKWINNDYFSVSPLLSQTLLRKKWGTEE